MLQNEWHHHQETENTVAVVRLDLQYARRRQRAVKKIEDSSLLHSKCE